MKERDREGLAERDREREGGRKRGRERENAGAKEEEKGRWCRRWRRGDRYRHFPVSCHVLRRATFELYEEMPGMNYSWQSPNRALALAYSSPVSSAILPVERRPSARAAKTNKNCARERNRGWTIVSVRRRGEVRPARDHQRLLSSPPCVPPAPPPLAAPTFRLPPAR